MLFKGYFLSKSELVPTQSIKWLGAIIGYRELTFSVLNRKILKLKSLLTDAYINNKFSK